MKKLLTFLCLLPLFTNAQNTLQGITFSPSFINIESKSVLYCSNWLPPPWATNCTIEAPNSFGLTLNYWRRSEGEKSPVFAEGGMGLRYVTNQIREVELTREADAPDIILEQYEAERDVHTMSLHFSMAGGYRFQIKQTPVRVYAGIFTDLPVWGKRTNQSFSTLFYDHHVVMDPVCQCMVLVKTPLSQPVTETDGKWKHTRYDYDYMGHLAGGLLGFDVDLPLKSKHLISAGYRYEWVLNSMEQFRSHKPVDFHNLNLSIGFAKNRETANELPERKNKGFVLGTEANLMLYDDGDTRNLAGFDFAFGYNTRKGLRPELRLGIFNEWIGKDAGGAALSGGIAFPMFDDYFVTRTGLTYAVWWEWASELTNKSAGIYGGAGIQYPNTGWLRMEVSLVARVWFGQSSAVFQLWTFGYGVYYFFGKR